MKKQVGHARETIAKATTTGSGKTGGMSSPKGNRMNTPKIHVKNKLTK